MGGVSFPYVTPAFGVMDGYDLVYTLVLLCAGFAVVWLAAKVFHVRRAGVPHLGAILVAFLLSPFHPLAIVVAIVPFALGFLTGRSTKIAMDPTDPFSPRIKLSCEDYSRVAEQRHQFARSPAAQLFYENPRIHWTGKLSFLFQGFGLYRHARGLALATSWLYISIWGWANSGNGDLYVLLFLLSLPFGNAMGSLWKYAKGHPGSRKPSIVGRPFRPTLWSFVHSSLYRMTPAMTGAAIVYFFYEKNGAIAVVTAVLSALFCIYLLLQTIVVHTQRIYLLDDAIVISGIGRPYGIPWSEVEKAVVRERHNLLSGTDKLLVIVSRQGAQMAYPVSILSRDAQKHVLREVRRRVPTSSVFDDPTV